jgi:hypothetical protein
MLLAFASSYGSNASRGLVVSVSTSYVFVDKIKARIPLGALRLLQLIPNNRVSNNSYC